MTLNYNRLPDPTNVKEFVTKHYLNELIRALNHAFSRFLTLQDLPATDGYVAKTANYTLTSKDYTVDATANSFTFTLPTAVGIAGKVFRIKNSGSGTISVDTTSSQTVDLNPPAAISLSQGDSITLQSTGENWIIIASV